MEEIGRGCHVSYLHVAILMLTLQLIRRWKDSRILITQLQISFHPTGRMLWALPVVPVRKREDEARTLQPFDFSRSNELIDNALSIVGKIAKLRLPYDKSIGR
jgi:hypothetical protein